jgi:hypothetical protein
MDSWKEMDKIAFEITCLEIIYSGLSEKNRALITFPQYVAFRKPSWSKWDILLMSVVFNQSLDSRVCFRGNSMQKV